MACKRVADLTEHLITTANDDPNVINSSAVNYLHTVGYLCYAYMYVLTVKACTDKDGDFYADKVRLADYFTARILPRLHAHAVMAKNGADSIMAFDEGFFG